MRKNRIELGDLVEDKHTGFKGTAYGRTQWLYGCERITVQPKVGADGKVGESISFDEPSLIVLEKVEEQEAKRTAAARTKGGPATVSSRSKP